MPDSGEWYGCIKGFSLWNRGQIQDGKRQEKQLLARSSSVPCALPRWFMCEWTWYRCLRPNQVGGWEPSSHHLSPFFCWFTTWPGRSVLSESSVGWRAQEHAGNGCADLHTVPYIPWKLTVLSAKYVDVGFVNSALYNTTTACWVDPLLCCWSYRKWIQVCCPFLWHVMCMDIWY